MPRRRGDEVVVDPVVVALELDSPEESSPGDRTDDAGATSGSSKCALGHEADVRDRFCPTCGLAMDAPAPTVRAEVTRPRPASQLTAEERAERERQHAEALRLNREVDNAPETYVPPEGETVVIHFVEDGFTFAGKVWCRGQEIEIGPAHPRWPEVVRWITMDKYQQIDFYGKQFFDRGPWPGRQSYLDGADSFQRLKTEDKKSSFAGPGEEALRQADEAERRRGRAVPAPLAGVW